MRKFLITLTSAALIAALVLILVSTGFIPKSVDTLSPNGPKQRPFPFTMEYTAEEQHTLAATDFLSIYNPLGQIKIQGAEVEEIEIKMVKKAKGVTVGKTEELLKNISLEKKAAELTVHLPKTSNNEQVSADLSLIVPFELVIQVQAALGNVEVKDFWGELQVQSDLGDITLRNCTTNVFLETSLGNIKIVDSQFPKELKAVTHLGNIHLRGSMAKTTILESRLGNIEILLPQQEAYILKGQIKLGSFSSQIPFQGQKREQSVEGIIGSGEQRGTLFVELDLGSLSFKALPDKKEED